MEDEAKSKAPEAGMGRLPGAEAADLLKRLSPTGDKKEMPN